MMHRLSYLLFRLVVGLFWLMPFWGLYRLSDILYVVFYRLVKYRYEVVYGNIRKSFPEKSEAQIQDIVRGAYRNFTDILLEGIKGMRMSQKTLTKRFRVTNPAILEPFYKNNKDVVVIAAHYGNWEWGISIGGQLSHCVVGAYKPLKNKYINDFVENARALENVVVLPKQKTFRYMAAPTAKPRAMVLIADQSPSNVRAAHWLSFLGRDTAFLNGPDSLARKQDLPVFFANTQRVRRGYYEVTFELLSDDAASTKEGHITRLYARRLETIIRQQPAHWLWTHRRWKKKRPEKSLST